MNGLWAVLPVKRLDLAKQRLAGALPPALRPDFMLAMAEDVLTALAATPGIDGIIVASDDPRAADVAGRHGATLCRDRAGEGHSEAVAAAAHLLAREGAAMLTVAGDVPLAAPDDFARLIAAVPRAPGFAIVAARDGLGSNVVLCAPADIVPLRFGGASFAPHLAAARTRGIEPVTLDLPRLALDIDDAGDLAAFLAVPSRGNARALLDRRATVAEVRP